MKLLLVAVLVGCAVAFERPYSLDYHNEVGVPLATKIRAAEEAINFDASRIVGGAPTTLGQYPYLAGLVIALTDGRMSVCSGSLLTSTKGITAAHCWSSGNLQATFFEVVLGSLFLFSGGTRVTTSNVLMHSGYNSFLHNDVAIMTLPTIEFTDVISPVRLPYGPLLNTNLEGWTAKAAGFGRYADGASISDHHFQSHVELEIISNTVCRRTYGFLTVVSTTLCTSGAGGKSTCSGDSGGPLTTELDGVDVLVGVTSFGHRDGCELEYPAGFSRVSEFMTWINNNL